MSHLYILICRREEADPPEQLTELHRLELPAMDVEQLTPETALDQLEAGAWATGQEVIRRLIQAQWQQVDAQVAADYQRLFPPG